MNIKFLTFFLILLCIKVNAQEFKLGKVSVAELQEKVHPKDSSAVAAVLFKKAQTSYNYSKEQGFIITTKVIVRIKIYKKEGYNYANQEVQFYTPINNIKETVTFSDVATFNLVNEKIEKTKLNGEGEFDVKVNDYLSVKKITLPNVKEGSVLEFSYTIRTNNIAVFKDFYFQTSIPVNYAEYTTLIPEYFVYNVKMKGFIVPKTSVSKSNKTFTINYKQDAGQGSAVTTQNAHSQEITYLETKTVYSAEHLPAMKNEVFVNNLDNYVAGLVHEVSMMEFPYSIPKFYTTTWGDVVKNIYDNNNFGSELDKKGYFEDDLKKVIQDATNQDEIILKILNYVKATVKWNGNYGYYCKEGVKNAYKIKTGNAAEVNLILIAMLRSAGLTANPVLISTRNHGISIFPNRGAYDFIIGAVETPQGLILLDATTKYSIPNVLPFRDLNWFGRLIRKDGTSIEVELMPKKASANEPILQYNIDAVGKVTGKLMRQRTDHIAMIFRSEIDNSTKEDYLEKFENENQKIEITDYSRTNEKEVELPIIESFSFTGENFCDVIAEKIYIRPLLFLSNSKNPFTQESREYPVDYGHSLVEKYSVSIKIPDGYTVESLPTSEQLNMENDIGSFKFVTKASGNLIQVNVTNQINTPIVSAEYYSMLKNYYQDMIAKKAQKIILKKI